MDPQQYKLNLALLEKLKKKSNVTTNEKTNRTDEMKKMNNIIQTNNNTTWTDSEPVRWFLSAAIVALFLYAMYALYKYELVLPTVLTLITIWLIASAIIMVKETINTLLD